MREKLLNICSTSWREAYEVEIGALYGVLVNGFIGSYLYWTFYGSFSGFLSVSVFGILTLSYTICYTLSFVLRISLLLLTPTVLFLGLFTEVEGVFAYYFIGDLETL